MADLEKPWQDYECFLSEKLLTALSPYDLQPIMAKFMRVEADLNGYMREEMAVGVYLNSLYEHEGKAEEGEVLYHEEKPLSAMIVEAASCEDSQAAIVQNVKADRDALAKSLAKLDEWLEQNGSK